jgi:formylmethanofuran dehydrogenase subunit C
VNGAIVHTWQGTKTGREVVALEVLGRAVAYYDELAKEGRIHGHQEVFCIGSEMTGLIIITGDVDELRRIEMEESYTRILGEASLVAEGFRSVAMMGGGADDISEGVTSYVETLGRLGIS